MINSQDKNALIVVFLILIIIALFFVMFLFHPKQETKPAEVYHLPPASKLGESVGQTSGNFVQGLFKGLYKSTKDGK